jgi:lipopolysaccharide export system protein LptC
MDIRSPITGIKNDPLQNYLSARRHSARVRRLKILLPLAAIVISLCFIAVSWISTMFPDNLKIAGATIENGRVVMEKPEISGLNQDGISYFMNARRALQAIVNPSDITLEDIEAAVPVRGDLVARIKASAAYFDRDSDKLDMTAPFDVVLSSGLKASLKSAHLDVRAGSMYSDDPVSISAKGATLVADSVKITDKGRVFFFKGQVRMVVDPRVVRQSPDKAK